MSWAEMKKAMRVRPEDAPTVEQRRAAAEDALHRYTGGALDLADYEMKLSMVTDLLADLRHLLDAYAEADRGYSIDMSDDADLLYIQAWQRYMVDRHFTY